MRRLLARGMVVATFVVVGLTVPSLAQAALPANCPASHPTGSVVTTVSGVQHTLAVTLTYNAAQVSATKACDAYMKFSVKMENAGATDDSYTVVSADLPGSWVKNKTLTPSDLSPGIANIYTGSLTARSYHATFAWASSVSGVPFALNIYVGRAPSGPFEQQVYKGVPNPCVMKDVYAATRGTEGGGTYNF